MKIYTRTGDGGETALFDGTRVSKADPRVDAYGHVDELNALLGQVRAAGVPADIDEQLDRIQRDLFADPQQEYAKAVQFYKHEVDWANRIPELKTAQGIGYCNITKCCTKVCPESIQITDNGIIPLKERVVDQFYDPLGWIWSKRKETKIDADSR